MLKITLDRMLLAFEAAYHDAVRVHEEHTYPCGGGFENAPDPIGSAYVETYNIASRRIQERHQRLHNLKEELTPCSTPSQS